jgi:hypothetical protein
MPTPFVKNYIVAVLLGVAAVIFVTMTRWEKHKGLVEEERALVGITVDQWFTTTDRGRGIIAQQLVRDKVLIGKTKAELINWLGQPGHDDGYHMVYHVGSSERRRLSDIMTTHVLMIRYNSQTEIVEDASVKIDD